MSSSTESQGDEVWRRLVEADRTYSEARLALHRAGQQGLDIYQMLSGALKTPLQRGVALRLLRTFDPVQLRPLVRDLVYLASQAHSDISLVRGLIRSIDEQWLTEHLPDEIERVLQEHATDEEYRRLAEMLRVLHSPYLSTLLDEAAASDDPDIREVAEDFRNSGSQAVDI